MYQFACIPLGDVVAQFRGCGGSVKGMWWLSCQSAHGPGFESGISPTCQGHVSS